MPTQSLMWTTLPNGLTEGEEGLRVSVLLSPRLVVDNEVPRLSSFIPDWKNWPDTLNRATFRIHYGTADVEVPVNQTSGPNRVDTSIAQLDPDAWNAMFPDDLFVRSSKFQDLSGNKVLSYDTVKVAELVTSLYRKLGVSESDELPNVSQVVDDPQWQQLRTSVAEMDQRYFDRQTGLRDVSGHFRDSRSGEQVFRHPTTNLLAQMQLFHTPPLRPKPTTKKRDNDPRITATWMEYEQHEMPDEKTLVEQLDFHQVVAAMNQYPTLLRALGLVVDFVLDRQAFANSPDAPLWTEVSFEQPLAIQPSPTASPRTHAQLSPTRFQPVTNPLLEDDFELRVVDGLLHLDPQRFQLLQTDVDGAGLKLMNFARSLNRFAGQRVDSVSRFEHELGAPALKTAGLMLVHRDRGSALQHRFGENSKKNASAAPQLWAEDLVRGFRFDVWDSDAVFDGTTGKWLSLCQRLATYDLNDGQVVIGVEPYEEEGTVRMAATKSSDRTFNQDMVYLHESLVTWAGTSLAAPSPGRALLPDDTVDPSDQTQATVPDGIRLESRFKTLPGSLPRLRFGRRYWLRGRVVDLAGNSLPPQREDFGSEQADQRAETFLRYEPIAPPVVALVKPTNGPVQPPVEGESMERMVIRSFNDPYDKLDGTNEESHRFAVPPQVSVRDAEQHGRFDSDGKVDPAWFDLLANQKDKVAGDPGAALQEKKFATQGPLAESPPVETTYAVYLDGHAMTYLPDPLAEEVAVRVFRHPNIDDRTIIPIPLYPVNDDGTFPPTWPEAVPFKIRVYEDPKAAPYYQADVHTLQIPLPKGIRAQVRLSMKPSDLDTLGVWSWLSESAPDKVKTDAENGQHWMLTPWKTIDVVHAVQRPLIAPKVTDHEVERILGQTNAVPCFEAKCSIKSTDRLDLLAEWHEPVDDPAASDSAEIAADQTRRETAFSIKISDPDLYAMQLLGHDDGGIAEHTINGTDLIEVKILDDIGAEVKYHEFHDTRYRRIEYRLDATTRFREYLPTDRLTVEFANKKFPTDKHIKVEGEPFVDWIPSSAPPPVPQVLYVVPTFGWVRTPDGDEPNEDGSVTSWRRGGGLRVYLDRPWMASGYGEMLAVVLPPASFTGDPEIEPEVYPYKKCATQWGNDPIWLSPFVSGIAPRRRDFPLARTAPDPKGGWLPENAPEDEKDQLPGTFQVTQLQPPGVPPGVPVEIAPHDVYYDADRRLWYCDIEINQGASYYPFIRLALARYQPISVDNAHLSEVVLADFMPLTADRWLHVNPTDDPLTRRVSVSGHSYRDSSGRREAVRAQLGISGQSVIEVWVERLDSSRGADFGWERVDKAVVRPDRTPARDRAAEPRDTEPRDTEPDFLAGEQIARALQLQEEQRYDLLAREKLIDHIIRVRPLWSGQVTLPSEPSERDRYRLVVAEYEEYLADPDRVRERRDRRLVFVEHVELR